MVCEACRGGIQQPFEFTMAFHPIVDATQRKVWGYEALVRGANGEGAGQILSQVDETNRYMFDQSCRIKAIELASSLFPKDDCPILSINFLPNAVYQPAACIKATLDAADRFDFPAEKIMFEFTEREQIDDTDHIKAIIAEYKRRKLITAIDDFGAGYAGLGLLAEFQPDFIKVDMNLVRRVNCDPTRRAILAGTIAMAKTLDITVVAEGVEDLQDYAALREMGIDLFQGYLFAFPKIAALPEVNWPKGHPTTVRVQARAS